MYGPSSELRPYISIDMESFARDLAWNYKPTRPTMAYTSSTFDLEMT
jgi:hypothetical protein